MSSPSEPILTVVKAVHVNKYLRSPQASSDRASTSSSSTATLEAPTSLSGQDTGGVGIGDKRKALIYNDGTFSITLHHYDSIVGELKCPACAQPLHGPIFLCQTGHSICSRCAARVSCCPLCPKKMTDMRNYTLEAIAGKVHFPCDHSARGCPVRLPLDLLFWHKDRCGFKQIDCFMGKVWENCRWKDCEKDWIEHCVTEHRDKVYSSPDIVLTWNYSADSQRCIQLQSVIAYYVIRAYGEYFNVYQIYDQNSLRSIWTVICATKKSKISGQFAFELELYSPIESAKLLVQRFPCHSECDSDFLKDGHCAKISIQEAMRFMTKEKVLYYRIRIIEVTPSRSRSLVLISQSQKVPTAPSSFQLLPVNYAATKIHQANMKAVSEKDIIVRNGIDPTGAKATQPTKLDRTDVVHSPVSITSSASSTITDSEDDSEKAALPEVDRELSAGAAATIKAKATSTPILSRVNSFPKPPRVQIQNNPTVLNMAKSGSEQQLVRCRIVENQESFKMKPIYSGKSKDSSNRTSSESLSKSPNRKLSKFYNLTTYKAAAKLWSKKEVPVQGDNSG
ncbi:uncharacterized protein LOC131689455 [Topomyia yanbarensis]|uniref:uncharacterized protein LOC131689455 n=1 Tax=Topomyia yanbarensis TaxID=2498891 RepID=UPI00273C1351|nr:uncharacterized protein LOC131689455 [Topomyia yanbarensis]